MLTGEMPFDADTPLGIAMKHVNGHLVPPQALNPEIPDGINPATRPPPPLGTAMKHVNGHLVPPQALNPEIPDGINAVTVRLLQKDPSDRYATDDELIEDIERGAPGLDPPRAA